MKGETTSDVRTRIGIDTAGGPDRVNPKLCTCREPSRSRRRDHVARATRRRYVARRALRHAPSRAKISSGVMIEPHTPRRSIVRAARRFLLNSPTDGVPSTPDDVPPRLTPAALDEVRRMSRSRERILANLDDMYREAFERAKATSDQSQMTALDFAYRREQLYFEILLDIRDGLERR